MPKIEMLCLDIDGTLLNSHHQITPLTRDAIVRAHKEKGVRVILMSSRMPQGMSPFLEELGFDAPMSCYGGGLIVEGDNVLYNQPMKLETARKACKIALDCGAHPTMWTDKHWYAREMDTLVANEEIIIGRPPVLSDYVKLFKSWELEGFSPNKVLCMAQPPVIDSLTRRLEQEEGDWELARSKDVYLEINPKGISKGGSVLFLCKHYGITTGKVMAIGDQDNDLSMILTAGLGIAMGNSPDYIKAKARDVTASNDEDGIALAIEKYIL